ncbi:MAG TPA: acyl-CoA dehydrogenase family protein, partial [Deltaproteobacteria bacterium]|nr:acyl-CoA dehydrogenase family protein [Deltaproteobacteria bacterium]
MSRNLDELFLSPKKSMDEESLSVARLVRQWADKEIVSKRMEYREGYERLFTEKRKKLSLDIGIQKLAIPADHGGFGWNSPSKAPALLTLACEIGRADASIGFLSAATWALSLAADAHGKGKERFGILADIAADETVRTPALILTGPGFTGVQTPLFLGRSILASAKKSEHGFTLNGRGLRPLVAGGMADLFCVVCARGDNTPCLAIVPGDAQGVKRGAPILMTGLNACGNAQIDLYDTPVPAEGFLEGEEITAGLFAWLNLLLAGVGVGAATNFFELLADWSDHRVIKGGSIL